MGKKRKVNTAPAAVQPSHHQQPPPPPPPAAPQPLPQQQHQRQPTPAASRQPQPDQRRREQFDADGNRKRGRRGGKKQKKKKNKKVKTEDGALSVGGGSDDEDDGDDDGGGGGGSGSVQGGQGAAGGGGGAAASKKRRRRNSSGPSTSPSPGPSTSSSTSSSSSTLSIGALPSATGVGGSSSLSASSSSTPGADSHGKGKGKAKVLPPLPPVEEDEQEEEVSQGPLKQKKAVTPGSTTPASATAAASSNLPTRKSSSPSPSTGSQTSTTSSATLVSRSTPAASPSPTLTGSSGGSPPPSPASPKVTSRSSTVVQDMREGGESQADEGAELGGGRVPQHSQRPHSHTASPATAAGALLASLAPGVTEDNTPPPQSGGVDVEMEDGEHVPDGREKGKERAGDGDAQVHQVGFVSDSESMDVDGVGVDVPGVGVVEGKKEQAGVVEGNIKGKQVEKSTVVVASQAVVTGKETATSSIASSRITPDSTTAASLSSSSSETPLTPTNSSPSTPSSVQAGLCGSSAVSTSVLESRLSQDSAYVPFPAEVDSEDLYRFRCGAKMCTWAVIAMRGPDGRWRIMLQMCSWTHMHLLQGLAPPPPPPANSAAQPSAHSQTNPSASPSSAGAPPTKHSSGAHGQGEPESQREESGAVVGVDEQPGGVNKAQKDGKGGSSSHYMDTRPPVFTRGDVSALSNANAIAGPCPRSPRRKPQKKGQKQGADPLAPLQNTVAQLSLPRNAREDTLALPIASQDVRAVEAFEFFDAFGAKGMLKEQGWVLVDAKSSKKVVPKPVPPRTGPFRPATIPTPRPAPPPQPDQPAPPAQPRLHAPRPFAKTMFVPDEDGVHCYYRILEWDLAHCPPSQLALLTSLRCEETLHYDEDEQRDMGRTWDEQGDSTIYGIAEYHDPAPVEGGEEAAEQELVEYGWNGLWYEGKQEGGGGGLGGAGGGVGGLGPGGGGGGPGGGGGNGGGGGGPGGGGGHGGGGAGAGHYDGGDEEDDDEEVEQEVKAPPRPPSPQQPRLGSVVRHRRRTSWAEADGEDNDGKIPPKPQSSAVQPPRSTTSTTSSRTTATTSTSTTPSAAKPSETNISAGTGKRTFGGQNVLRQYGRKNAAQPQVAAHKAAEEAPGLGQREQGSGIKERERDKKGKDVQPETLVLSSGSSSSDDDGDFEVVSFLPVEPVQSLSQTRKPRPSPSSTRARKGACKIFSQDGQVKREEDEDEEDKPLLTREQVRRDPYGHLEESSSGTDFSQLSPSYTNDGLPVGEASSPYSMSDPEPISGWTATFPSLHKMNPLKDPDDEPWAGPVGLYSKEAIDRVRSFGSDYYLLFQLNELIRAADGHSLFIRSRNSLYLFDRDLRKSEAALLTKTYGEGHEPPSLFPPNRSLSSSFDRLNDLIKGLAKKARFGEGTSSFGTDISTVVKSRRAAAAAAFAKKSSKRRPRGSLSTAALGTLGYGKGPVNVDLRRVIRLGGKRKRRAIRHYLKRPEAWLDEDELPP